MTCDENIRTGIREDRLEAREQVLIIWVRAVFRTGFEFPIR